MAPPSWTRSSIIRYLPFAESTTPLQAITYLLGISLFSISFLVFLNSSVSFVITDLIGVKDGVGDIVGTLGFVDEIVALIACPIWGLVSDRSGVRYVAVAGYTVIGLSLFLFVQAHNVYPQLLLARIFFAVGATAAATMVTAILPSLTDENPYLSDVIPKPPSRLDRQRQRQSITPSIDSEVTITPERFRNNSSSNGSSNSSTDNNENGGNILSSAGGANTAAGGGGKPSALAGYVGLFTGCGALVALSLFLPLPARFGKIEGVTLGDAVKYSFYVVGAISLCVAVFVFFGLRGLKGEEGKGWRMLFGLPPHSSSSNGHARSNSNIIDFSRDAEGQVAPPKQQAVAPYLQLLRESVTLGFTDSEITLGYLGGFVARASTVAISLFIPLFVNAFFIRNGYCHGLPNDPSPELKKECRQAYVLASILTGVAQLTGLVCAPVFGYLSSRTNRGTGSSGKVNYPILVATVLGIVGYIGFSRLQSPEYKDVDGRGGKPVVFLYAAMVGISQIGAIVCSLGSLGRGVLKGDVVGVVTAGTAGNATGDGDQETLVETAVTGESAPLLSDGRILPGSDYLATGNGAENEDEIAVVVPVEDVVSRVRLKGSVAGVYSWCGGAAILLLTKLGGWLFDEWDTGAPFYLMAGFNAALLAASLAIDLGRARARAKARRGALTFR
ncbi:hypothetical protein QBC37DRAFT_36398 [Rhypophila decipiens]|uniref:MFS transporter n=1 Tax=Rhypophila decipiens TaxID=261697 RepID=A0AAN7B512_9PEZI|nr:hypothetical protein QBC37DRAFT_36398 [Rhypophila decipiens]